MQVLLVWAGLLLCPWVQQYDAVEGALGVAWVRLLRTELLSWVVWKAVGAGGLVPVPAAVLPVESVWKAARSWLIWAPWAAIVAA